MKFLFWIKCNYNLDQFSTIINKNENNFLRKIINTLQKTVDKFIHWVCLKFSVSEEDEFIRNFEFENDTYLDPEKQIEYEEEKEDYNEFEI